MEPNNCDIINTTKHGERVTSIYAEVYHDDDYCSRPSPSQLKYGPTKVVKKRKYCDMDDNASDDWVSPSDLLIGIIELKPPFTSKITRGKTHEGILKIGDEKLQAERVQFIKKLTQLLYENDAAWSDIMKHELASVIKKVEDIYWNIFLNKSEIMKKEISDFYEETLQEIEDKLKDELNGVFISAHAKFVSDMNKEMQRKLAKEKLILDKVLKRRYESEISKIKHYYKLLLDNEMQRNKKLVNKAIIERNEALSAFCKESEASNITRTMYTMCLERKKCKVKQFLMKTYQDRDLTDKMDKIREREDIIDQFKKREKLIIDINNEWEKKIQKVLQVFLKFISFTLKLLPEQATFLLDLEKMVVLQLNEIQKKPQKASLILQNEDNLFKFEKLEEPETECLNDPIVIAGDSSATIPPRYGSSESLPPGVELPYVRLQRQYIYAKCHKYEEVKAFLESQRCKCLVKPCKQEPSTESCDSMKTEEIKPLEKESSSELLIIEDIQRLQECPERDCKDWIKHQTFPYLNSYLDFNEENYERVKLILGKLPDLPPTPELINAKSIVNMELPFSATKELYHTVGTQYSSLQDVHVTEISCPCTETVWPKQPDYIVEETASKTINELMVRRRQSIKRLIQQHPGVLEMFTDERLDFVL